MYGRAADGSVFTASRLSEELTRYGRDVFLCITSAPSRSKSTAKYLRCRAAPEPTPSLRFVYKMVVHYIFAFFTNCDCKTVLVCREVMLSMHPLKESSWDCLGVFGMLCPSPLPVLPSREMRRSPCLFFSQILRTWERLNQVWIQIQQFPFSFFNIARLSISQISRHAGLSTRAIEPRSRYWSSRYINKSG